MAAIDRPTGGLRCLALAAVAYTAAIAFAYIPVVFLGATLEAAQLHPLPLSEPGQGRQPKPIFNVDLATPAHYERPIDVMVGRELRAGRLPLWAPHIGTGVPLLQQYSSRLLFPFQWLVDVMPRTSWDFFALARPLIAALGVFALLRRALGSTASAFLGGLLYALSGAFTWFIQLQQFTNVAMTAPYVLLAVDPLSERAARTHHALWAAIALAMLMVAGQPEMAVPVLALAGLWLCVRSSPPQRARLRALPRLLIASLLALGFSAPLLLPFAEFAASSFHLHPAGGVMGRISPTPGQYAAALLLPRITYRSAPAVDLPLNGVWDMCGGYIGVLCALLACCAWFVPATASRRLARTTWLFGTVVLLKNLDIVPFAWLGELPLLDQVWTPRWAGPAWVLAFCLSAASTAHAWYEPRERASEQPERRQRIATVATAIALAIASAALALSYATSRPRTTAEQFMAALEPIGRPSPTFWIALAPAAVLCACGALVLMRSARRDRALGSLACLALAELSYSVPRGYDVGSCVWALLPVALLVVAAGLIGTGRARAAGATFAAAAIAAMVVDAAAPFGLPPRTDPLQAAPHVRYLQREAGIARAVGVGDLLYPNSAAAHGLLTPYSAVALEPSAMHGATASMLPPGVPWFLRLWLSGLPLLAPGKQPIERATTAMTTMKAAADHYAFFGVRYVAVRRAHEDRLLELHGPGTLKRVWRGAPVSIYQIPHALPRAFVAHGVELETPDRLPSARIHRGGADPLVSVTVDRGRTLQQPSAPARRRVEVVGYQPDEVTMRSESTSAALVVLTDTYEPGWGATVDGVDTPLVRVAGVVRGVFVPAGTHVIHMVYRPASWYAGLVCWSAAAIAALAYLALSRRRAQ